MRIIILLLLINTAHSAPYDWQKNSMLYTPPKSKPTTYITKPNPYQNGIRTTDNKGSVWITEQNPYNKKELRTRKIH